MFFTRTGYTNGWNEGREQEREKRNNFFWKTNFWPPNFLPSLINLTDVFPNNKGRITTLVLKPTERCEPFQFAMFGVILKVGEPLQFDVLPGKFLVGLEFSHPGRNFDAPSPPVQILPKFYTAGLFHPISEIFK